MSATTTDELVLRSRDGTTLTFRTTHRHPVSEVPIRAHSGSIDFDVEVDASEFTGRACASTHFVGSPSQLFRSMAQAWKGWLGAMEWKGLDSYVVFKASSDAVGHIRLDVELSGQTYDCRLRVPLFFEAGQLDSIADQVQNLLG